MAAQDEVRLAVPATPEFLRLARVTASGIASRLGFTYDEVEDLRLAIDELCFVLIGSRGRKGSTVNLRYRVLGDGLEVHGAGSFEDGGSPSLAAFSQQILTALVDEYEVFSDDDGHANFRLLKLRKATSVRP